ncbi:MAG: hypothetical protein EBS01_06490 [Verrucomicrobia bacterium]|nr:hypothetical protein [Verrucomicrobiota bacterium]
MASSFIKGQSAKSAGRDNLFLWTVFLLLLAGVVFCCWLGSFYVFEHPENPRAYRLLKRLNKLPPPVRFELTKAPAGDFLEAQRVFERYSKFTAAQFAYENDILFRNYLRNYGETKRLVPYLTGKYVILKTYELQKTDLFTSGVVILTQSTAFPQMLAEIVCPTPAENVKELLSLLQPGLEVRLKKTLDLSAIVQVSHAVDGRLQVTVVPLLYGNYALKNGVGSFSLEPPGILNVAAGFPLVRGEEVVGGVAAGVPANPAPVEETKPSALAPPVTVAAPEASPRAPVSASLPNSVEKVGPETLPATAPRVQLVQESQGSRPARTEAKTTSANQSPKPPAAPGAPIEAPAPTQPGAVSVPRTGDSAVASAASVPAPSSVAAAPNAPSSAVAQAFLATRSQSPEGAAVQQPPASKAGKAGKAGARLPAKSAIARVCSLFWETPLFWQIPL